MEKRAPVGARNCSCDDLQVVEFRKNSEKTGPIFWFDDLQVEFSRGCERRMSVRAQFLRRAFSGDSIRAPARLR
jgi:hypothetical protein